MDPPENIELITFLVRSGNPKGLLAVDVFFKLLMNIMDGMVVWPKVVERHVTEELPFMATEFILMESVKAGGTGRSSTRRQGCISWTRGGS